MSNITDSPAANSAAVTDQSHPDVSRSVSGSESTLANASLKDVRKTIAGQSGSGKNPELLLISSDQSSTTSSAISLSTDSVAPQKEERGDSNKSSQVSDGSARSAEGLAHERSGIVVQQETLTRSIHELELTEKFLLDKTTSSDDRLRAAGVLAANGRRGFTSGDGEKVKFSVDADSLVKLSIADGTGHVTETSGKLTADGHIQPGQESKQPHADQSTQPPQLKPTGVDGLMDPTLSQEDKLRIAQDMAHQGQRKFTSADGKQFEIGIHNFGPRESVTIMQVDAHGNHPFLRGVLDADGLVQKQTDRHGKSVDYSSDWAKKHDAGNLLLRHDEPKRQEHEDGDKTQDGRDKAGELTPDQKRLEESRKRLQADAEKNLQTAPEKQQFIKDMQSLEERAKTQPLSTKEVADTYDQLSRLMEAETGAVLKENRILAAKTFAHHMGDPTNIDQGDHLTCNVTSLEEHIVTRNPSKAAELIATMAIDGHWVAPDGKEIKITSDSLAPGREEQGGVPADGARSYATQLMNVALANDICQRKIPPQFYSQERVTEHATTGERLRYADGTDVKELNPKTHQMVAVNAPNACCTEISDAGTRLTGDTNYLIANQAADDSAKLLHVSSPDTLGQVLKDMKANGKLPGIILVNANDPIFDGSGDPTRPAAWHVVSVVGYDETTGQVILSNQWGKRFDRTVSLSDLYRSTKPSVTV